MYLYYIVSLLGNTRIRTQVVAVLSTNDKVNSWCLYVYQSGPHLVHSVRGAYLLWRSGNCMETSSKTYCYILVMT